MTEDEANEWDEDRDSSDDALERLCHECHAPTIGEQCGFCGNDLCPACFEMGAGFCSAEHTQEQIDAYEDEVYPPANAQEAEERKQQRQRRNELKQLEFL